MISTDSRRKLAVAAILATGVAVALLMAYPADEAQPKALENDNNTVNQSITNQSDNNETVVKESEEDQADKQSKNQKLVKITNISYRNTFQIGYAGVWRNGEFSQAKKLPQDAELVTGSNGETYSQSLYKINENGNITITNPETFTDEVGQTALIDYRQGENHQLSMELSTTEDLEITVKINGETRTTLLNTTDTSNTEPEEATARTVNIELGNLETGQEHTADITFESLESGKTRTKKYSFTAE